jgi:hypothetical protein
LIAQHRSAPVVICVDLKTDDKEVERDVLAIVREHKVLDRLLFIGRAISEPDVRRRLRQAAPEAHVAALANNREELLAALSDGDSDWAYLRFIPSREEVARIHAAGTRIFLAGPMVAAHEERNWQAASDAGVGGILTDFPLELARQLRGRD